MISIMRRRRLCRYYFITTIRSIAITLLCVFPYHKDLYASVLERFVYVQLHLRHNLLAWWQDLQDANTRDGVLIRDLCRNTISGGENDIDLSNGRQLAVTPRGDLINLVISVTTSDADFDVVGVEAGEEDGVDWSVFASNETSVKSVAVGAAEGDWGGAGSVWILRWLKSKLWEWGEGEGWARAEASDELSSKGENLLEVEWRVEWFWEW